MNRQAQRKSLTANKTIHASIVPAPFCRHYENPTTMKALSKDYATVIARLAVLRPQRPSVRPGPASAALSSPTAQAVRLRS